MMTNVERDKALREQLWAARRFASLVCIEAYRPSQAGTLQHKGNQLIDDIDRVLDETYTPQPAADPRED